MTWKYGLIDYCYYIILYNIYTVLRTSTIKQPEQGDKSYNTRHYPQTAHRTESAHTGSREYPPATALPDPGYW